MAVPKKGPRLSHTKSRKGCTRCKQRKVKCDETKPSCKNCTRHELPCQYVSEGLSGHRTSRDSTPRGNQQELLIEDVLKPDERRLLELQLLHHFMSVVSYAFPSSNLRLARDMWANYALNLSFQHPVMLNAIFAITALHILNGGSTGSRFFSEDEDQNTVARVVNAQIRLVCRVPPAVLHPVYLSLAIKQQQEAVSSQHADDRDITNAIFLSTVLLSYHALVPYSGIDEAPRIYSPPTHWLRMVHGITATAENVNIVATSTPQRGLVGDNLVQFLAQSGGSPDFRDEAAIFNPTNREPFEALLDWVNFPEPLGFDESYIVTYEKALSYVGGVYRSILNGESPRVIFRWILCFAIKVPTEFITFLEERRPRAIAILAHHCAMAYNVDDHWIFHGFAEREVEGLGSLLPPEWSWAMKWPVDMIKSLKQRNSNSPQE